MIVILLSTAIPIFSQCPHNKVVGSGVGISTLSQALSSGVLTINGAGEVIGSFCINGTFDLNIGKNFRNVSILCLSGSILRKNTLPHPGGIQQAVIFFYSSIEGLSGSQLVVENGSNYSHSILAFVGGNVENFPEVRMDNYASIILSSGAAFAHNKKVLVDNHSVLINYGSLFLESPVEADHSSTVASYTGSIFETDCMEETCAPAISLKQNSSLVARGTAFFDSYLGIDCTNCAVINLFESEVNTLVGINSLNNLNYFDIKSSYVGDQNTEFGTAANMSNEINIENSGLKSGYYVPLGIEDVGKLDIHSNPDIYGEKIIIGNAVQGKIENNNFDSGIWLNDCNLDMLGNQIHGSPFNTIWDYTSIGGHSGLIYDNWFFDGCSLETPMETYFECNYLVGVSDFGYSFELSDGMDVSVKANEFSSTIFIENDFIPQINQGNKFEIGVHGAEGVAVDVNTSFFKVADDPAEFPSHTPAGLFINTGKTNVCGGGIVNDDDDKNKCFGPYLKYKLKLVKKLLACSKQSLAIKGKCHANIKLALQIIKKCPNLLSDSLINVEYYKFIESDFNKLYNFDVLQSKLYSQKSTLVYPNINFSEISNLDELQEGLSVLYQPPKYWTDC